MGKRWLASFLLLAGVAIPQSTQPHKAASLKKPETPHFLFAKEYVRELIADEDLNSVRKKLSEAKSPDDLFSTGIYFSKSVQLELRSQIRILKEMRLDAPFETLIPMLIASQEKQIELHQKLIQIDSSFLAGPKPGVDYSALTAKVPQISAELDKTQQEGVQHIAVMVFWTLIDPKPDSQNHVSHLIITKAEKADLQRDLDIILKDQPSEGDHDYYVGAAMILRAGFLKGHKCADEAWD